MVRTKKCGAVPFPWMGPEEIHALDAETIVFTCIEVIFSRRNLKKKHVPIGCRVYEINFFD